MNKYLYLAVSLIAAVILWGVLIQPKVPTEISDLKIGDSIKDVRHSASWITTDGKDYDNTWWSGQTMQNRYGVEYRWVFDMDFDKTGCLVRVEGRSYNHITGLLDKTYKLNR